LKAKRHCIALASTTIGKILAEKYRPYGFDQARHLIQSIKK